MPTTHRISGNFRLVIAILLLVSSFWSYAESDQAPGTGYFKVEFSPLELLGEQGVADAVDMEPVTCRQESNLDRGKRLRDSSCCWKTHVPGDAGAA
jgi:hypothetical protein